MQLLESLNTKNEWPVAPKSLNHISLFANRETKKFKKHGQIPLYKWKQFLFKIQDFW